MVQMLSTLVSMPAAAPAAATSGRDQQPAGAVAFSDELRRAGRPHAAEAAVTAAPSGVAPAEDVEAAVEPSPVEYEGPGAPTTGQGDDFPAETGQVAGGELPPLTEGPDGDDLDEGPEAVAGALWPGLQIGLVFGRSSATLQDSPGKGGLAAVARKAWGGEEALARGLGQIHRQVTSGDPEAPYIAPASPYIAPATPENEPQQVFTPLPAGTGAGTRFGIQPAEEVSAGEDPETPGLAAAVLEPQVADPAAVRVNHNPPEPVLSDVGIAASGTARAREATPPEITAAGYGPSAGASLAPDLPAPGGAHSRPAGPAPAPAFRMDPDEESAGPEAPGPEGSPGPDVPDASARPAAARGLTVRTARPETGPQATRLEGLPYRAAAFEGGVPRPEVAAGTASGVGTSAPGGPGPRPAADTASAASSATESRPDEAGPDGPVQRAGLKAATASRASAGAAPETSLPLRTPEVASAQGPTPAGEAAAAEDARPGSREDVFSQVAAQARLLRRPGGAGTLEVQLRPAALGRVFMRVETVPGGRLQLVLRAERPHVAEAMSRGAGELVQALERHGLQVGSIDVACSGSPARHDAGGALSGPGNPASPGFGGLQAGSQGQWTAGRHAAAGDGGGGPRGAYGYPETQPATAPAVLAAAIDRMAGWGTGRRLNVFA